MQAALVADMRQRDMARLAWRLRAAEARALEASDPWLLRSLADAGVPAVDVDEVGRVMASDIGRCRDRLTDLGAIAEHL
jgi:hypothetical protein